MQKNISLNMVQTLWTAHKSLLEDSFGWLHPQFHLMSWALSCLSLKENYENVVLYTDEEGKHILGDILHLPYSDIKVVYQDLECPPQHWAYAKIKTYSAQLKPFLHVDGDVFISRRLDRCIESAPLVAQNLEKASSYYERMIERIIKRHPYLPVCFTKELHSALPGSYNAGVIGGNDLGFIHDYSMLAISYIRRNHLDKCNCVSEDINYNIWFEQMLFYALAKDRQKEVTTIFPDSVQDNGYTYSEFCDFYKYDHSILLHIIGGHKQNERVCNMLAKTLLRKYPDYYWRIIGLFPERNSRFCNKESGRDKVVPSIRRCMAEYENALSQKVREWKVLSKKELFRLERGNAESLLFLNADLDHQRHYVMGSIPYISYFEMPDTWPEEAMHLLKRRIDREKDRPDYTIVWSPCLLGKGYRELLVNNVSYNILRLCEKERPYGEVYDTIIRLLPPEWQGDKYRGYRLVMKSMEYLFYHGLLYVKDDPDT